MLSLYHSKTMFPRMLADQSLLKLKEVIRRKNVLAIRLVVLTDYYYHTCLIGFKLNMTPVIVSSVVD